MGVVGAVTPSEQLNLTLEQIADSELFRQENGLWKWRCKCRCVGANYLKEATAIRDHEQHFRDSYHQAYVLSGS